MVGEERGKRWELTQERALEIYEIIQNSLDPSTWEVLVKSENAKVQIGEFIEKARKRTTYFPENSVYNPSVVADDALTIVENLPQAFDNLRNRLEDAFRSILVVNEDMNQYIRAMEDDIRNARAETEHYKEENEALREQILRLKEDLRLKEAGIQPLFDIIQFRVNDIIKMYDEFKAVLGSDEEMRKFIPIFEREIETTVKVIKLKQEQIFKSSLDYREMSDAYKQMPPMKVTTRGVAEPEPEDDLAQIDDQAEFTQMTTDEDEDAAVASGKPIGRPQKPQPTDTERQAEELRRIRTEMGKPPEGTKRRK